MTSIFDRKTIYKNYLKSDEWKKLKQETIDRDGGRCRKCHGCYCQEVHHIKYPKDFKDDCLENVISVCSKCHKEIHGIKRQVEELDEDFILSLTVNNKKNEELGK